MPLGVTTWGVGVEQKYPVEVTELQIKRAFLRGACLVSMALKCCFLILVLFLPQDLEGKIIVDELKQEVISTSSKAEPPQCTSLAWSADGQVSGCVLR